MAADGVGGAVGFPAVAQPEAAPMGKYILRVSPEEVQRLHLKPPPEQEINLKGAEPFVSGMDITVESTTLPKK